MTERHAARTSGWTGPRSSVLCVAQCVTVRGLRVMADIGVHAHEHGAPQPLDIDVVLLVRPVEQDSLEATVDYSNIKRSAEALAMRRISLIETYAHELATTLCTHPQVLEASVAIAKPNALEGCLAGTEITLRKRG